MSVLFKNATKIIVGVVSALIQVANLFLGNIIVFETTEGVKFNWIGLLRSKLFWVVLIAMVIYYLIPFAIKQQEITVDERLEEAISDSSIKLISFATESAQKKDFESSKSAIKILDKIQKRRRR